MKRNWPGCARSWELQTGMDWVAGPGKFMLGASNTVCYIFCSTHTYATQVDDPQEKRETDKPQLQPTLLQGCRMLPKASTSAGECSPFQWPVPSTFKPCSSRSGSKAAASPPPPHPTAAHVQGCQGGEGRQVRRQALQAAVGQIQVRQRAQRLQGRDHTVPPAA